MSLRSSRRGARWLSIASLLAGGCLLQTATSCNALAAEAISGLASSIVTSFIYSSVSEALNVPGSTGGFSGLSGLGGLTGLGT